MDVTMYWISAGNLDEIISIACDYIERNGHHISLPDLFDNDDFHKYVNECLPVSYELSEREKLTKFDNIRKVK